jgi:hypothetical protein
MTQYYSQTTLHKGDLEYSNQKLLLQLGMPALIQRIGKPYKSCILCFPIDLNFNVAFLPKCISIRISQGVRTQLTLRLSKGVKSQLTQRLSQGVSQGVRSQLKLRLSQGVSSELSLHRSRQLALAISQALFTGSSLNCSSG